MALSRLLLLQLKEEQGVELLFMELQKRMMGLLWRLLVGSQQELVLVPFILFARGMKLGCCRFGKGAQRIILVILQSFQKGTTRLVSSKFSKRHSFWRILAQFSLQILVN